MTYSQSQYRLYLHLCRKWPYPSDLRGLFYSAREIAAVYAETGSSRETGRRYGVSGPTITAALRKAGPQYAAMIKGYGGKNNATGKGGRRMK